MPTYEYVCSKCDQHLEVYQSFSEEPLKRHSGCGGKLSKVLGSVGIVLKGSGFYRTDNASSSRRSAERSDSSSGKSDSSSSSDSKSDSKSDSSSSSKSDTKPAQVRQEDRHQEVGLAGPGGDGRPHAWRHRHPHSPTWCHHRTRGTPMLRRSPRTALAWAAAAVVAVVTAATVVSLLASLRHQDEAYGALHPVVGRPPRPHRRHARDGRPTSTRRRIRGEAPEADALTAAAGRRPGRARPAAPRRDGHRPPPRRHRRDGLGGVVPAGRRAVRLVVEHGLRPRRRRPRRRARHVRSRDDRRRRRPDDRGRARGHRRRGRRRAADAGDTVAVTVLVTPAPVDAARVRRRGRDDQPRAGATGVGRDGVSAPVEGRCARRAT